MIHNLDMVCKVEFQCRGFTIPDFAGSQSPMPGVYLRSMTLARIVKPRKTQLVNTVEYRTLQWQDFTIHNFGMIRKVQCCVFTIHDFGMDCKAQCWNFTIHNLGMDREVQCPDLTIHDFGVDRKVQCPDILRSTTLAWIVKSNAGTLQSTPLAWIVKSNARTFYDPRLWHGS